MTKYEIKAPKAITKHFSVVPDNQISWVEKTCFKYAGIVTDPFEEYLEESCDDLKKIHEGFTCDGRTSKLNLCFDFGELEKEIISYTEVVEKLNIKFEGNTLDFQKNFKRKDGPTAEEIYCSKKKVIKNGKNGTVTLDNGHLFIFTHVGDTLPNMVAFTRDETCVDEGDDSRYYQFSRLDNNIGLYQKITNITVGEKKKINLSVEAGGHKQTEPDFVLRVQPILFETKKVKKAKKKSYK